MERHIYVVTRKFLSSNGIRLSIMTKVVPTSRQKRVKIKYTLDTGSVGNLLPPNIFKILFPEASTEELAKYTDKSII